MSIGVDEGAAPSPVGMTYVAWALCWSAATQIEEGLWGLVSVQLPRRGGRGAAVPAHVPTVGAAPIKTSAPPDDPPTHECAAPDRRVATRSRPPKR